MTAGSARRVDPPTLLVGPPTQGDELAAILTAAARLAPPDSDPRAEALVYGDHLLNPDLIPRRGEPELRRSAVLVALAADVEGRLSIILTERAANLSAHAGQIALPGGRIEPGETPAAAAVREAEEEVALPAAAVRALGIAEPYATRTGYLVFPVLAVVTRPATLRPNPGEVAAAFTVPISAALALREGSAMFEGRSRRIYETTFGDRRIWGITAGILKLVADRLS